MPAIWDPTNYESGRPGNDFDMAATILFLAGPGGVFYNEQILYPDGGKSSATISHFAC